MNTSYEEKYIEILEELSRMYECDEIDSEKFNYAFNRITNFYEGSTVNNIPRSEAKRAGNYGKDKLTPEEDDKHYRKRLYRATTGSPLTYAHRKLDEVFAPTKEDKEKAIKRAGEGKKFKLTGEDIKKITKSKGKDLTKALGKGVVRDTFYDVAKQQATTFGSLPGQVIGATIGGTVAGPAGATALGTAGQLTGASIGSLNQNVGTAAKLTKVLSDALTKIDNSDLSANDKKVLKTKARLVAQRYLKQHSNSKHIEDKYMIDLGKKINRELYGKTSSIKEFKKLSKELQDKAKNEENKTAAAEGAKKLGKKVITREIPDKEGVKELGNSVATIAKSVPNIAYRAASIGAKKAGEKIPVGQPALQKVRANT